MSQDEEKLKKLNSSWVNARHACSMSEMFERLKLSVQADVDLRNALRDEHKNYKFNFVGSGSSFSVVREGNMISYKAVSFHCRGNTLVVTDYDDKVLLEATLTLNDEGECKFRVKGQERDSWQIRRMALEPMFFEGLDPRQRQA